MSSQTLVIIDIQNEYFEGGKVPLDKPEKAAENARSLLGLFRQNGWPVVHVRHAMPPERGMPFLLEGTDGQKIHVAVEPAQGETIVSKMFPNAFRETSLLTVLQELKSKSLVLAGMMTHMCVDSTARAAFDLGYELTIAGDATATCALPSGDELLDAEVVRKSSLASLHGIIARVASTAELVSDLQIKLTPKSA